MSFAPRNEYNQPPRRPPARRRRRRTPFAFKLLALIGVIAVIVVLGRLVVVPLLVYLNSLGLGG